MNMAERNIYFLENVSLIKGTKDAYKEILKNVNLRIREKEVVCIMGPTGCGKSSLMRLLSGLDAVTDGIIMLDDSDIKQGIGKKVRRDIGIVYQSDNLFEWRTVYKNVREPLEVFGLLKSMDTDARIMQMLELTGLKNYKDCYPKELSGGMRQRCAIARGLVHDPKILLLDQPFGALDAITRKALGTELLKIHHETEKTIVMVTNSIQEEIMLADRIVVLSDAPATVREIVEVPLSYEERNQNRGENETFHVLSDRLNQLVHMQSV